MREFTRLTRSIKQEFEQLLKPQRWRQAFAKMDVDGDVKITEDEFALFCETFFSSAAAGDIFQKSKEQVRVARNQEKLSP